MTGRHHGESDPTPAELRERIERTREELGRTVEALAVKADVKAQAKEKTAAVKEQATERAALVTAQVRGRVEQAAHAAADKTPDPVLEQAARAATAARANKGALLAVGAVVIVFLLVRRGRECRSE
ncbi:DUF3618 domain-containing protein [Streptomyces sp. NPDC101733]|uniref:DUF3618 domain-containing protein n=1 Tax=unclassified Streptomyces TaxID=2593676 RepID=UPI00380CF766